ncbi:type II toxin-antitoxin system VapC family toxin [soil metagenome]
MTYLLDTVMVSEARKPRPDPGVAAWFDQASSSELYLSVLVLGEIRQGIERLAPRDPAQAAVYTAFLHELRDTYSDRVLGVDQEVADRWGRINAPAPLPVIDGLLAATALVHDLVVVTRNTADIARTPARVLNPFQADASQ